MLRESAKWHEVSLRLTGDTVPVDSVGLALRLKPEYVGRKGDHIGWEPTLREARYQCLDSPFHHESQGSIRTPIDGSGKTT